MFLSSLFCLTGLAKEVTENEKTEILEDFEQVLEALPEGTKEELPEGFFSGKDLSIASALTALCTPSSIGKILWKALQAAFPDLLSFFCTVLGVLLLSALLSTVSCSFSSQEIKKIFSLLSTVFIFTVLFEKTFGTVFSFSEYFENLCKLIRAYLPLTAALYTLGGNVTASAASTAGLGVYLTVVEEFIMKTLPLFCTVSFCFAMVCAILPQVKISGLLNSLKKNYTAVLGFFMTLLSALLTTQGVLASKTDTLALKSAKYVTGSLLPVLGSSIGELLKSVSAEVGYLRGIFGACGIWLVLLLLLPTLVKLFLSHFLMQFLSGVAELFGCDAEKKFLGEAASVCGYLMAALSISSAVAILLFSLLAHTASAIG